MDIDKFKKAVGKFNEIVGRFNDGLEKNVKVKIRHAKDDYVMEYAERGVPIAVEEAKRRGLIPRD